ncbi:MAG TPA: hypothetical protein PLR02_05175 [Rhodocyclaceae bacterium]|nr:hypothetical protein [Rhodocyclaceae bacterium]
MMGSNAGVLLRTSSRAFWPLPDTLSCALVMTSRPGERAGVLNTLTHSAARSGVLPGECSSTRRGSPTADTRTASPSREAYAEGNGIWINAATSKLEAKAFALGAASVICMAVIDEKSLLG